MKSVALHNRLTSIILRTFTLLLFLVFSVSSYSQDIDEVRQKEGKSLFKSQCASCHKLERKLVGPALGCIESRRENEWLKAWIKNNAALRASGDADAIAVYEEYNGSAMTAFPQLSDQNIDDILYYTTVGELPKKAPEQVAGAPVAVTSSSPTLIIYLLAAAILVAFAMIASLLKQVN